MVPHSAAALRFRPGSAISAGVGDPDCAIAIPTDADAPAFAGIA
ncbi:hypothetical protein [Brevibacterium marinum]|uniref:Uncharacterized protein n=1 Tax=Brevibacterium marinum TaxID=418643 RepID=A0A846RXI9_9MICO|nr:hypothetical protein [Brevibacterium marinum]NJC56145.1 hypothetical protein [Brevibacterium marinum]